MQQIKLTRGFTLVELLLAIFLVGLFAYFVFATPGDVKTPKERVTIATLPHYFQKNLTGNGEVVCIDNCKTCYYVTNSKKPQKAPIPAFIKNVVAEYVIDSNNNPTKIELGRFKDKKICMRFRHYNNNSISQFILDLGNKVLFIPSYFGEGKEFGSVNEAANWWLRDSQNQLRSRGDWY